MEAELSLSRAHKLLMEADMEPKTP